MSPDWSSRPEDVPYANLTDPQTLNLYGYLGSNTMHGTDPDGHSPQTEEAETRYQTYMRQASMGAPPSNRKGSAHQPVSQAGHDFIKDYENQVLRCMTQAEKVRLETGLLVTVITSRGMLVQSNCRRRRHSFRVMSLVWPLTSQQTLMCQ